MTMHQFISWGEKRRCCRCERTATFLCKYEGPNYCDEHYPYQDYEKDGSEKDGSEDNTG